MTRRFKILKLASGILFSGIGVSLILYVFLPVNKNEYFKLDKKLISLTGYLINDPYYHKATGKTPAYFKIELNTYPGANFQNEGEFLKATEWGHIKVDVKYHDTVTIKVLKEDFEKFYIKRDSMNVLQIIVNYPFDKFSFYSFKFRNKEYVSDLYEAAKEHKRDRSTGLFICGLIFIGMAIYCFVAKE